MFLPKDLTLLPDLRTYIINMLECIEDIIRQAREKINHKPAFQVVHTYYLWVRDDFSRRPDKRGVEIEDYIDEKDNVHDTIDNEQWHGIQSLLSECRVIWNHDGGVKSEHKDEPVPRGFEE